MAKKKKNALPKKIAGVTVPKALRRSSMLRTLLGTKMGREIAAQALIAAAGAAAAVLIREREEVVEAADTGVRKGAKAAGLAAEAVESAANAALGVVTDAAKSILPEDSDKQKKPQPGPARDLVKH